MSRRRLPFLHSHAFTSGVALDQVEQREVASDVAATASAAATTAAATASATSGVFSAFLSGNDVALAATGNAHNNHMGNATTVKRMPPPAYPRGMDLKQAAMEFSMAAPGQQPRSRSSDTLVRAPRLLFIARLAP